MSKTTTIPVPQNIESSGATFVNADGTAWKQIATGGANDSLVKMAGATSTDTALQNIQLGVSADAGVTVRPIGTLPVAANSGTNGTAPSVDLLNTSQLVQLCIDSNGKPFLPLQTGYTLHAKMLVAVTAAKQIDVVCAVEKY